MGSKQVMQQALNVLLSDAVSLTDEVLEVIAALQREIDLHAPLEYDEILKLNKHRFNVWNSVKFARSIEAAHGIK